MFVSVKYNYKIAKKIVCLLDGVDISNDCYAASDTKGVALCYKKNADNKKYLENNKVAREIRRGDVVFLPIKDVL